MGNTYREPARDIPVLAEYDVVVCGGGPAGCAAALAAARHGARTLLLEKEGYLGGAVITQTVAVILSTNGVDFQGVWHEYARRLKRREGIRPLGRTGRGNIWGSVDPELVKHVWDELLSEAGVDLLHHVYAATAIVQDPSMDSEQRGVARGVLVETKAGRQAILARRVIDATGDGIVCAQAGVPWEQGDGEHPYAMSCTKVLRLGNVSWTEDWPTEAQLEKLEADLDAAVARAEYTAPVVTTKARLLNYIRGKYWRLPAHRREYLSVISRVLKVDPLDPFDFTRAEREGREQARQAADFYCRFVPGFEEAYLLDTNGHIGVRSTRRVRGLARVTAEDATKLIKYADSIARCSWTIDVWPADSYTASADAHPDEEWYARIRAGDYFDIRYGCLVAQGIDNLLMAGRCISAAHEAEASLRIQQTCMATGQAAGTAAALSLAEGITPRELDPQKVVAHLDLDRAAIEPAFDMLKDLPVMPRPKA